VNDHLGHLSIPTTAMAKGLGSSGRGATMERSKLSLKQESKTVGPKLDDGMGGGGIGKGIFNGGGGDGDDGDDDDYAGDFGEHQQPGQQLAPFFLSRVASFVLAIMAMFKY
jgi:hypothetical protein